MEHAMVRSSRSSVEDVFPANLLERDDELASATGLRNAILISAALWALLIWCVMRFVI